MKSPRTNQSIVSPVARPQQLVRADLGKVTGGTTTTQPSYGAETSLALGMHVDNAAKVFNTLANVMSAISDATSDVVDNMA